MLLVLSNKKKFPGDEEECQPDERGDRRAETVVESQEGRRQWCTDGIRSQPDRNKTERKVDTVCTTLHRGPILENSLIRGMTDEAQKGRAVTPAGQSKEPATGATGRRQAFVRSLRSRAAHAKGVISRSAPLCCSRPAGACPPKQKQQNQASRGAMPCCHWDLGGHHGTPILLSTLTPIACGPPASGCVDVEL